MTLTDDDFVELLRQRVHPLVEECRLVVHGHPPEIQGAVLCDLMAIYLAGHIVRGDPIETDRLREALLGEMIAAIRNLTRLNAEAMQAWHASEQARAEREAAASEGTTTPTPH